MEIHSVDGFAIINHLLDHSDKIALQANAVNRGASKIVEKVTIQKPSAHSKYVIPRCTGLFDNSRDFAVLSQIHSICSPNEVWI